MNPEDEIRDARRDITRLENERRECIECGGKGFTNGSSCLSCAWRHFEIDDLQRHMALEDGLMNNNPFDDSDATGYVPCEADVEAETVRPKLRVDTFTDSLGIRSKSVTDPQTGVVTKVIENYRPVEHPHAPTSEAPGINTRCPRCGFLTSNVFDCLTCKTGGTNLYPETPVLILSRHAASQLYNRLGKLTSIVANRVRDKETMGALLDELFEIDAILRGGK